MERVTPARAKKNGTEGKTKKVTASSGWRSREIIVSHRRRRYVHKYDFREDR